MAIGSAKNKIHFFHIGFSYIGCSMASNIYPIFLYSTYGFFCCKVSCICIGSARIYLYFILFSDDLLQFYEICPLPWHFYIYFLYIQTLLSFVFPLFFCFILSFFVINSYIFFKLSISF